MTSPWDKARAKSIPAAQVAPSNDARELRLYGFNAVQAMFAKRPQALRKLPDYRFSGTQPYFDGQAWLLPWICEYYDLPADTAIVYND